MLMLVVEALEIVPLSCASGGGLLSDWPFRGGELAGRPGCREAHRCKCILQSGLHSFCDPPDPPCRDKATLCDRPSSGFDASQPWVGAECHSHSCCSVNTRTRPKSTHESVAYLTKVGTISISRPFLEPVPQFLYTRQQSRLPRSTERHISSETPRLNYGGSDKFQKATILRAGRDYALFPTQPGP